MRPKRIAFYGNFGDGNLGNEVTLQTAIEHTRRRWPDAELECICTGPEDVRVRHGIAAFCSVAGARGRSLWGLAAESAAGGSEAPGGAGMSPAPGRVISRWRGWIANQRAKRGAAFRLALWSFRSLRRIIYRLPLEVGHWVGSWRVIARSDMLIVPGTGILTDHRCGPWVWPYELFKYCALARLCRVEVAFLSVGAGPVHHALSRWFIRTSLAFARYRSYRDEDSRRCVEQLGFDAGRDSVYPDLVFGLGRRAPPPNAATDARGKVVGLGLKDYSGAGEGGDDADYRQYLEEMALFVLWLGRRGFTVRLLIGDVQYDTRVRRDLLELLRSRTAGGESPRVLTEPVPTVPELIRQLAESDVVISPRLHNLILALILRKPVIALCDLPKVKALLDELQLAEYCVPMEGLDVDSVSNRFVELEGHAVQLKAHIDGRVESYQHAVEQQYAVVFDDA